MTPLDFMELRNFLAPASGFQSVNFRLIENKFGVKNKFRVNGKTYLKFFKDPKVIDNIKKSESESSLFELFQRWLERTPGLEEHGFNFWGKYKKAVTTMLEQNRAAAEAETDPMEKGIMLDE